MQERKARLADISSALELDGISSIEARCFERPWSRESLESIMKLSGVVCAVIDADAGPGGPIGYALLRDTAGEAEIFKLAVAPGARRQGLGRELAGFALKKVARAGCTRAHLECRASNHAAIGLYTSLGFRISGRRKEYYPPPDIETASEDAVTMSKELSPGYCISAMEK